MKTIKSSVIALIALSIFASNAFGLIRSPYPRKPTTPDTIIVIIDEGMTGKVKQVRQIHDRTKV
jgi:hypothetical protein